MAKGNLPLIQAPIWADLNSVQRSPERWTDADADRSHARKLHADVRSVTSAVLQRTKHLITNATRDLEPEVARPVRPTCETEPSGHAWGNPPDKRLRQPTGARCRRCSIPESCYYALTTAPVRRRASISNCTRRPGSSLLTVAPADAIRARRFFARTGATACVSTPPIDRRRLCAPRPPTWPIAPGSIRARDAPRESARRSRLNAGPRQWRATIIWPDRPPIVRLPKRSGRGGSRTCSEPSKGRPGVMGHRQPPVPRRRPQRLDVHRR